VVPVPKEKKKGVGRQKRRTSFRHHGIENWGDIPRSSVMNIKVVRLLTISARTKKNCEWYKKRCKRSTYISSKSFPPSFWEVTEKSPKRSAAKSPILDAWENLTSILTLGGKKRNGKGVRSKKNIAVRQFPELVAAPIPKLSRKRRVRRKIRKKGGGAKRLPETSGGQATSTWSSDCSGREGLKKKKAPEVTGNSPRYPGRRIKLSCPLGPTKSWGGGASSASLVGKPLRT